MTESELRMVDRQCRQVIKNQPNLQLSYATIRAFMPNERERSQALIRKFAHGLRAAIADELDKRNRKAKEDLFDNDQRGSPE